MAGKRKQVAQFVIRLGDGRYWTGSEWSDDVSAAKKYASQEIASRVRTPISMSGFPHIEEL